MTTQSDSNSPTDAYESQYHMQQQQQQQQIQMCTREQRTPPPPPQIMRPSRVSKHFKNPPQPHMCIKDYTHDGQELFINVMSWTKICMPQNATDPIPLYGGMRVHSLSPRSPPLVYAVMANPDILKHVGRKCSDAEEKVALVELMCDFVEAMNPGLKLARDAEVLKDRDLSGELKDIWGAVQAKREREKEPNYGNYSQNDIYIEFGPETSQERRGLPPSHDYNNHQNPNSDEDLHRLANTALNLHESTNHAPPPSYDAIKHDKINVTAANEIAAAQLIENVMQQVSPVPPPALPATEAAIDEIDAPLTKTPNEATTITPNEASTKSTNDVPSSPTNIHSSNNKSAPPSPIEGNGKPAEIIDTTTPITIKQQNSASIPTTTSTMTTTTTTKKEKVAGFLPNSCHNIFPFMKSKSNNEKNKHHNKDKEENQKNSKKSIKLTKEEIKNELAHTDLNNKVHSKE